MKPWFAVLAMLLFACSARAEARSTDRTPPSERVTCSIAAGLKFGVPINIVLAVAEAEGGRAGQWVRNRNGSYDVGPLQFNTRYLEHLQRQYGICPADVAAAGCYAYELAAWRLRRHIQLDRGDLWTRVANYHSREPNENANYRRRLVAKAASWGRWLSRRFATYDVTARAEATRRQGAAGNPGRNDDEDGVELASLLEQIDTGVPSDAVREIESRSVGRAHPGSLLDGVQLPRHRAYRLLDASRAWGTSRTIGSLIEAFDEIVAADPRAPLVEVHDLSLRLGGRMHGHKSHQSGRDVDITYYQRGTRSLCVGRHVAPTELDAVRQWRLLHHWLERSEAEFIFMDYSLQRPLYEAAKATGATERQLADWFQYPRGSEVRAGIIRHVPNHGNHVHVRFRCASEDPSCARISDSPGRRFEDESENELRELLEE